jgi:plasmid maintenance system antidote protein VapI
MERLGITQTELAEHLGKKRPYVTAVLNGKRPWPDGMLQRCEAFVACREQGRDRD